MKFDGVYFQTLMTKFMLCNNADRHSRMNPIKNNVMANNGMKFNLF